MDIEIEKGTIENNMDMLDIFVAVWTFNRKMTSSQRVNFKKFCKDNNLFENYESVYEYWERKEYDMAIVMGGL